LMSRIVSMLLSHIDVTVVVVSVKL